MFKYIFGNNVEKEIKQERFKKINIPVIERKVFVVIDKNSLITLGVFDSLEKAKLNGEKITYYNCMIIPFNINDSCKYLINPIFESK